jgi:hypothetical protein
MLLNLNQQQPKHQTMHSFTFTERDREDTDDGPETAPVDLRWPDLPEKLLPKIPSYLDDYNDCWTYEGIERFVTRRGIGKLKESITSIYTNFYEVSNP